MVAVFQDAEQVDGRGRGVGRRGERGGVCGGGDHLLNFQSERIDAESESFHHLGGVCSLLFVLTRCTDELVSGLCKGKNGGSACDGCHARAKTRTLARVNHLQEGKSLPKCVLKF